MSTLGSILARKKLDAAQKQIAKLFDALEDRATIRLSALTLFGLVSANNNVTWTGMADALSDFIKLGGATTRDRDVMSKPIARFMTGDSPGDAFIVRLLALYVAWQMETKQELRKKPTFRASYEMTDIFQKVILVLEQMLSNDLGDDQSDTKNDDDKQSHHRLENDMESADDRSRYRVVGYLVNFVEKRLVEMGAEAAPIDKDLENQFDQIGIRTDRDHWRLDYNEKEVYLHSSTTDGKHHLIAHVAVKSDWGQFSSWRYATQIANDLLEQTEALKQKKVAATQPE